MSDGYPIPEAIIRKHIFVSDDTRRPTRQVEEIPKIECKKSKKTLI